MAQGPLIAEVTIVTLSEGDTDPDLALEFDIPITGATITLNTDRPDGTPLTKTAIIDDGPNGLARIAWAAGDLIGGFSNFEIRIVQGAEIETFPKNQDIFLLDVRPAVKTP